MARLDLDFYRGKKVIVTGHTGFKGSWLVAALKLLSANVVGVSRGISDTSLISRSDTFINAVPSYRCDVNDLASLERIFSTEKPDLIFHLAAQPLVTAGYDYPHATFTTNVLGTLNVCEAFRKSETATNLVAITTDKVYKDQNWQWPYRENDYLGGSDPYSASKSSADIIANSYYQSYISKASTKNMFVMRGGNVIGGGDISANRLLPDFFKAHASNAMMEIRNPNAIRPWQHVIDLVNAYLIVGQSNQKFNDINFNIGPDAVSNISVSQIINKVITLTASSVKVHYQPAPHKETSILSLDSSKMKSCFDWSPLIPIEQAIKLTCDWIDTQGQDPYLVAQQQISQFIND